MASMESFANRVDKIFGSLGADTSPWRVRQQQRQETPTMLPSPRITAQDDDDDDDDEPELESAEDDEIDQERPSISSSSLPFQQLRRTKGPDGMDTEEDLEDEGLQMRSIIGLDCTLDFEEEEDEFDKTAIGREADKERLFMREINEADANHGFPESLPRSLYDLKFVTRDPRANHLAAKARLEEDARYAASLQEYQGKITAGYIETAVAQDPKTTDLISCLKRSSMESKCERSMVSQKSASAETLLGKNEDVQVENDDKAVKRVRFAPDIQEASSKKTGIMRPKPLSQFASEVPDFVRNPSRYTRYTLDWSVEDTEQTNLEAFHACFESIIRAKQSTESDDTGGMSAAERVRYIPRGNKSVEDYDQKIKGEDAEQTVVHINRTTMCGDEFEEENETLMELSDTMDREKVAGFSDAVEGNMTKATRRYRSKREAETEMELDRPE